MYSVDQNVEKNKSTSFWGPSGKFESNVFLPMTTVEFNVSFLKNFRSSEKCHGSSPLFPITLLLLIAATALRLAVAFLHILFIQQLEQL